jgi:alpha-beta hydrolase superfamily lysophospholipase
VKAVVSRGGRPDLAGKHLSQCNVPTLLLVGGRDSGVIELNKGAFEKLKTRDKEFKIIPGATHLFEEPGTLEEVCKEASGWFKKHLV